MARGPRFWALGVDCGPRGGAFEGILDPPKNNKKYMYLYLVFGRFPAELGPETRSNGSGSKNGAEGTQD